MIQNSFAMPSAQRSLLALLSLAVSLTPVVRVIAQVVPDQTMPTPTIVVPSAGQTVINGGTQRGGNLFHSFQEFSIPTGNAVQFNNSFAVQNIFARITGSHGSNIDGTIGANGSANLFLINPSGISFGRNARLNLGGSFLASTARAINFEDTSQFGAEANTSLPLLTTSAPIGLSFSNSGPIEVAGSGHRQLITSIGNTFAGQLLFTGQGQNDSGLQVRSGQTLALVGGDVTVLGGILSAPSGRVEVGSVKDGSVKLNSNSGGFRFESQPDTQLGSISLLRQSAIDATGDQLSNIRLWGRDIQINDASLLIIGNTGRGSVGNIELDASRQINLGGLTAFNRQDLLPFTQKITRSIVSLTDTGTGANIFLKSPVISLSDSAYVSALTFGSGQAGSIQVQANSLEVRSVSPLETAGIASSLSTTSYGSGMGGTISVAADRLRLADGGSLVTNAYRTGAAGDIRLNTQATVLDGGQPKILVNIFVPNATLTFIPTLLSSTSIDSSPSGNIFLQTKTLQVLNGAQFSTVSLGSGRAGSLIVNASESVTLDGTVRFNRADIQPLLTPAVKFVLTSLDIDPSEIILDRPTPSVLGSGAGLRNVFTTTVTNLENISQGTAGSAQITSPQVRVNDAQITVQNTGIGDAGSLAIRSDRITVSRGGSINAQTILGNGGNIFLDANQVLLRNQGQITASSQGSGNGGNIDINVGVAAILEQSKITANANRGFGGRINLSAIGLLRTPDSTISASSDQGQPFNGTISINEVQANPVETKPAASLPSTEPSVAVACAGQSGTPASFVISGKGGTATPADLSGQRGWVDPASQGNRSQFSSTEELVEAQGAVRLPNGEVAFVVAPTNPATAHAAPSPSPCSP